MESLYRKYRPQTFDDVVGQQHVVATLEHAVLEGRTSHAYLFCGPRGTGKTTMARLLAKALMCEQGPGHLPDGTCEQCRLIAAGEHPDVYELDAASRTGVDNVREEIINRVSYAPVSGTHKVYIIDEVHMLTTAAFNALLKTLEEPPSHVTFVLCTTDPQKVPETILSRVQRFDFHAISAAELSARLVYVCQQEGFTYDQAAIDLVVRHARGGMRDALSTLEQLSVFGDGTVSLESAQDLLGEVATSTLDTVAMALAQRNVPELFNQVGALVDGGRDLLQFSRELAARLRDVYVVAAVGTRDNVLSASPDELAALQGEAAAFGSVDRLARALGILGDASSEMRTATNQRLVLELAFTKIARPEADLTLDSLAERVDALERQVRALSQPRRAGAPAIAAASAPAPQAAPQAASAPQAAPVPQGEPQAAPVPQPASQMAPASQPQPAPAYQSAPTAQPVSDSRPTSMAQPATVQQAAPAQQPATTSRPVPTSQPAQAPQPAPTMQADQAASTTQPATSPSTQPAQTSQTAPSVAAASGAITDKGELQRRWRQVADGLLRTDPARGSLLMNSSLEEDDGGTLSVELHQVSSFAVKQLTRPEVSEVVERAVSEVFGRRRVSYRTSSGSVPAAPQPAPIPQSTKQPAPTSAAQQVSAPQSAPVAARQVVPEQAATATAPHPTLLSQPASSHLQVAAPAQQQATAPAHQQVAAPAQQQATAPTYQQVVAPAPQTAATPTPRPASSASAPWQDERPPFDEPAVYADELPPEAYDMPMAPAPQNSTFEPTQQNPTSAPQRMASAASSRPTSQPVSQSQTAAPQPTVPSSQPQTVAPQPAATPQPQVSAPQPAAPVARPQVAIPQPPAPIPEPAPQSDAAQDYVSFDPTDAASVMAMLTDIFGAGVRDRTNEQ